MSARVIVITREFGSGGRTIGRLCAEKLGWEFYDWNLVEKIARESGMAREFVEKNSEDLQNRYAWLFKTPYEIDLSDQLFIAQTRIIDQLAEKGNCVIVGRCADYILRERQDVLSCFIQASTKSKQERIVSEYGMTDVPVEKRLKDKDKKRKAHYEMYTGRKWGRAGYYDICLDTTHLPLEFCADMITQAARDFEKSVDAADE